MEIISNCENLVNNLQLFTEDKWMLSNNPYEVKEIMKKCSLGLRQMIVLV